MNPLTISRNENERVLIELVEAEHVASTLNGVFGEESRDGLEEALSREGAGRNQAFELVDQLVVHLTRLLNDPNVVLKGE